ncbi:hypothetical protein FZ103_04105 [Streptomonospora sp. PA3]|uniref:hypothetical protein n=1 Tax=Streptomonospora sp. PA3 TaxID=2607326 RepID=UPI0012DDC5EB|nr:hypothetical protein [Streptomonospora sp. PA3]MUL40368.1 hypothetical protein [Streptomonospora sp. PA3]
MPLHYALGHVLLFGFDAGLPQLPFAGPALGAFAVLAAAALGAALVRALRRACARPATDTAENSRRDFLLRSTRCDCEPPVRAPDTPGKPLPRAPGAAPATG